MGENELLSARRQTGPVAKPPSPLLLKKMLMIGIRQGTGHARYSEAPRGENITAGRLPLDNPAARNPGNTTSAAKITATTATDTARTG